MAVPRTERRLAAILAADVVGYSRLMERDERQTLERLKACRKDLVEPILAEHRGRLVKLMGDGLLCEFASVVDAVECAAAIQKGMAEREVELPEDERLRLRIGINLGDVIIDNEDIYGDGVNIAARMEQLAEPGGICISRSVHTQIRGKLNLKFEDQGDKQVKNIAEPVRVYRLILDDEARAPVTSAKPIPTKPTRRLGSAGTLAIAFVLLLGIGVALWWQLWTPSVEPASVARMDFPLPDKPSIAVLPFAKLTDDADLEYIADGVSEDIITSLSQLPNLFVTARTASFAYKGQSVEPRAIAEALGVRFLLEGSVRKGGDKLRITAQLIDALSGYHVWAESYDRTTDAFFDVQDDVVRRVVDALEINLTEGEQARLRRKFTNNPEAYKLYRLAENSLRRLTEADLQRAQELARQAIALDPDFVVAWGVLAWATFQYGRYFGQDPTMSSQEAEGLARQALALDPTHAPAFVLLGFISMYRREFDEAVLHGTRAIDLWPGSADIAALHGTILWYAGRNEEALSQLRQAMRLSPYHPDWYLAISGDALVRLGDYRGAVAEFEKLLARKPDGLNLSRALAGLAEAHARLGAHEQARQAIATLRQTSPWYTLSHIAETMRFKDQRMLEARLALLRDLGLPE